MHRRRGVDELRRRSDVELSGVPELQRRVRFNLFQLLQATARSEGRGVAAKGVSGRGYEGHYFWDTEIFVLPFLVHTDPAPGEAAAGASAAGSSARPASGPRRSATPERCIRGGRSPGEEASAWYAGGTAQYHINADIAYALHQYSRVSGDLGFVLEQGAEVLIDTARLWMDLGFFSERRGGRFCHQRRDRPGRVHDRRRQQRLYQPHGQGEPRDRRPRVGVAARPGRRGPRAPRPRDRADRGRGRRVAARRRAACTSRATRSSASSCRTSTSSSASRWDFEGDARRSTTRCCCTTTRSSSTATR